MLPEGQLHQSLRGLSTRSPGPALSERQRVETGSLGRDDTLLRNRVFPTDVDGGRGRPPFLGLEGAVDT
jgi:hypothetical protein